VRQTGAREQRSPSGRGGGGSGFTPDGTGLSTGANITSDKGIVDLTWVVDPGCAPTPPPPPPGPTAGAGGGEATAAVAVIAVARFTG